MTTAPAASELLSDAAIDAHFDCEHGFECDVCQHIHDQAKLANRPGLSVETTEKYEAAVSIIVMLVTLKMIKDSRGKTSDYLAQQPHAWKLAREFLQKVSPDDYASITEALEAEGK